MLNENMKIDIAISPKAVSSNGTTSTYFSMKDYDHAIFAWSVELASAGLTTTSTGTVYQALDGAATSGAGLASTTAIVTASSKLTSITIIPQTAIASADTFTLTSYDKKGTALTALTYTLTSCGTTATATIIRGVIIGTAGGTADFSTTCTYIAAAINDSTTGSVGLYGSATSTTVTIRSLNGGDTALLFTASNTTNFTISTATRMGIIEVNARAMTMSSNFTNLALNVVNESAYYTSAFVIRGKGSRYNNAQQAAKLTQLP